MFVICLLFVCYRINKPERFRAWYSRHSETRSSGYCVGSSGEDSDGGDDDCDVILDADIDIDADMVVDDEMVVDDDMVALVVGDGGRDDDTGASAATSASASVSTVTDRSPPPPRKSWYTPYRRVLQGRTTKCDHTHTYTHIHTHTHTYSHILTHTPGLMGFGSASTLGRR